MRRNTIFDKAVLGITSILLAAGVAYICTNHDDNRNRIATNVVDIRNNENNKIIMGTKLKELQNKLTKLQEEFNPDNELSIDINQQYSGVDFHIYDISNSDDSQNSIRNLIETDGFKNLEEYTGEEIGEEITAFFNKEDANDRISKVYSDSNTTINMEKYQYSGGGYSGDMTISIYDYEIEDSYYKDIDKMIRGEGYSLSEISQDDGTKEMIYEDIGFARGIDSDYSVNNEKINGVVVDLRILTKNNEISEVSLLGNSKANNKDEIIITEYQSELISRLVAALGIPQAEENIKELLFNSDTTDTMPETTEGEGYEIKSSYVIRERGNGDEYYSRLDIRAK